MTKTDTPPTWVFGYGSLIWRPGFEFIDSSPAIVHGWKRRFWQGSHDHRGTPESPGRVVTLIQSTDESCGGMAYLIEPDVVKATFETLDHREKNGYERFDVQLNLSDGRSESGVVYIAPVDNFAWLGKATQDVIAAQIAVSHGPSGANRDYLLELDRALRKLNYVDCHVTELTRRVNALLK